LAKRSSREMDVAVLQVLSESSPPMIMTHIMYRANVNEVAHRLINFLVEFSGLF
jgi:predicted transcriptional regulator